MTEVSLAFIYGVVQKRMAIDLIVAIDYTSISEVYAVLHLPHTLDSAKTSSEVKSPTKVRPEQIYDQPGVGGQLVLLITAGATEVAFSGIVTIDGLDHHVSGSTGEPFTLEIPVVVA